MSCCGGHFSARAVAATPMVEADPMHCVDPCRLTGLAKRKELNEHVVDRLETLASGRVKVSLLSMGGASMSVPAASLVPIPEVTDLRLSRRDASPAVLRRLLEAALLGAPRPSQ